MTLDNRNQSASIEQRENDLQVAERLVALLLDCMPGYAATKSLEDALVAVSARIAAAEAALS